jgi:hypothetical protein
MVKPLSSEQLKTVLEKLILRDFRGDFKGFQGRF